MTFNRRNSFNEFGKHVPHNADKSNTFDIVRKGSNNVKDSSGKKMGDLEEQAKQIKLESCILEGRKEKKLNELLSGKNGYRDNEVKNREKIEEEIKNLYQDKNSFFEEHSKSGEEIENIRNKLEEAINEKEAISDKKGYIDKSLEDMKKLDEEINDKNKLQDTSGKLDDLRQEKQNRQELSRKMQNGSFDEELPSLMEIADSVMKNSESNEEIEKFRQASKDTKAEKDELYSYYSKDRTVEISEKGDIEIPDEKHVEVKINGIMAIRNEMAPYLGKEQTDFVKDENKIELIAITSDENFAMNTRLLEQYRDKYDQKIAEWDTNYDPIKEDFDRLVKMEKAELNQGLESLEHALKMVEPVLQRKIDKQQITPLKQEIEQAQRDFDEKTEKYGYNEYMDNNDAYGFQDASDLYGQAIVRLDLETKVNELQEQKLSIIKSKAKDKKDSIKVVEAEISDKGKKIEQMEREFKQLYEYSKKEIGLRRKNSALKDIDDYKGHFTNLSEKNKLKGELMEKYEPLIKTADEVYAIGRKGYIRVIDSLISYKEIKVKENVKTLLSLLKDHNRSMLDKVKEKIIPIQSKSSEINKSISLLNKRISKIKKNESLSIEETLDEGNLSKYIKEIEALQGRKSEALDVATKNVGDLDGQVKKENSNVQGWDTKIKEADDKRQVLQGQLEASNNKISQLDVEIQEYKEEMLTQNNDIKDFDTKLKENKEKLEEIKRRKNDSKAEEARKLENKQKDLTSQKIQIESNITEITSNIAEITSNIEQLEEERKTKASDLDTLHKKILENKQDVAENIVQEKNNSISNIEIKNIEIRKNLEKKQELLKRESDDSAKLKEVSHNLFEARKNQTRIKRELNNLTEEIELHRFQIEDCKPEINHYNERIADLLEEQKLLKPQNEKIQRNIDHLRSQGLLAKETQESLNKIISENPDLENNIRNELLVCNENIGMMVALQADWEREVFKYEHGILIKKEELKNVDAYIETKNDERTALYKKISEDTKTISTYTSKITQALDEVSVLTERVQELRDKLGPNYGGSREQGVELHNEQNAEQLQFEEYKADYDKILKQEDEKKKSLDTKRQELKKVRQALNRVNFDLETIEMPLDPFSMEAFAKYGLDMVRSTIRQDNRDH